MGLKKCVKSCQQKSPCPKGCLKKSAVCSEKYACKDKCKSQVCCVEPEAYHRSSGTSACCRPGCSLRMPCLTCIKSGVKVQILSNKCKRPSVNFCDNPKPCSEDKRDECCKVLETECCVQIKSKQEPCKRQECDADDVIDYCKLYREKTKDEFGSPCIRNSSNTCVRKSNTCKNICQRPCTSCECSEKSITVCCTTDEKSCKKTSCSSQEKCCEKPCKSVNKCNVPKVSTCPKPCKSAEIEFSGKMVDANCTVYESYFPTQGDICCGPQKFPLYTVAQPPPCSCSLRCCGDPAYFQQALPLTSCLPAKRFP